MKNKNLLIIFTRNPELGKVKSRLAKSIGNEKALQIYKELLAHTRKISEHLDADKHLYYTNEISNSDAWDASIYEKKIQVTGDLGIKMGNAFESAFLLGYEKVIIIGSDIYDLTQSHIEYAFSCLDKTDTVIGPALDGGYYLLGLKMYIPSVFKNKNWGSDSVLKDTVEDLDTKFSISFLETLNDIDVISDIKHDSYLVNYL
ncbi:TIGR04282 family arsenosugar biosynthesis glycosyltransferase [Flavicella marina]|uniref:TIGR04282 family arsenosugar biosynthesis glycosyltransferase n=1 Tax=Flavicella marina TaxID=1475951 RepID=UPI0012640B66|nr:TIGR04282 family arsenosugar biosynthesis glycosyltransferase [Flavicella marina]